MAKFRPKRKVVKAVVIAFAIFILLPGVAVASYGGINYLQADSLFREGKSLVSVEKYDEALEKLAIADSKWILPGQKSKIQENITLALKAKAYKDNYDIGIGYYDSGKYTEAKDVLQRILEDSKYYKDAQAKISLIDEKLLASKSKTSSIKVASSTPAPTTDPNLNQN